MQHDVDPLEHQGASRLRVVCATADQSGLLRRGDIYVNLARAHVALDEKPKARAMLRRGLEEDGEHPELTGQLEALED
jgi:hypothetical protein